MINSNACASGKIITVADNLQQKNTLQTEQEAEEKQSEAVRADSGQSTLHPGLKSEVIAQRRERLSTQSPVLKSPQPWLHAYEPFLVTALILFLVGVSLAYGFPDFALLKPSICGTFTLMLLGLAISCIRQPTKRRCFQVSLWGLALLAGVQFYTLSHQAVPAHSLSRLFPPGSTVRIVTVTGILAASPDERKALLDVSTIDSQPVQGRVQITLPFSFPGQLRERLVAGRRIQVMGSLARPFQNATPGTFDQVAYLRSQGVNTVLSHTGHWLTGDLSDAFLYPLLRVADGLKRQVWQSFKAALPSPQAEVFAGIVLGDKAVPVDRQTKQAFIDTGLIHLLAASGMNVGIIAGSVFLILAAFRVPLRGQILAAMGTVAFYSLLTGLPPSIQRAAAMLEIALLFKLFDRQLSNIFLLCLVTCLLIGLQPELIGSIGFQFSVLSTFGLLAMTPSLQEWLGYYITRWLASLILVPFIAQLWILPLSVTYFNRFPLHSVPLNIVALVLITPLTVLGFVAALLGLLPQAVPLCTTIARPFLEGLLSLTHAGENQAWAQWTLPSPRPWQLLACYGLLFAALFWINRLQVRRWGNPRSWLLALSPALLILLGLSGEKSYFQSQAYLARLPLSDRQAAFLFKPEQSQSWLLLSPDRLHFSEARVLSDYLKHAQVHHLKAVLLRSEDGLEKTQKKQGNYLKRALKGTKIDWLITPAGTNDAKSIQAIQNRVLPEQGSLQIRLGSMTLLASKSEVRLNNGSYCILRQGLNTSVPCAGSQININDTAFIGAHLNGARLSVEKTQARP
jgi:ComEC/Rec2-related protein